MFGSCLFSSIFTCVNIYVWERVRAHVFVCDCAYLQNTMSEVNVSMSEKLVCKETKRITTIADTQSTRWLVQIRKGDRKDKNHENPTPIFRNVVCFIEYLQNWSLLNWHNLRFRCGCVAVPVNWFCDIISSCFAKFKNVVHSLEPGETPSNSASHQAPNYVQRY